MNPDLKRTFAHESESTYEIFGGATSLSGSLKRVSRHAVGVGSYCDRSTARYFLEKAIEAGVAVSPGSYVVIFTDGFDGNKSVYTFELETKVTIKC